MSRYIDADAYVEKAKYEAQAMPKECGFADYTEWLIDKTPSIDIVRCRECKYDGTWKCPWRNTQVPRYPSANDFCSYGSRSEKPNNSERSSR